MKALIIRQKVSAGVMDYIHGGGQYLNRVFVPDAENLVFGIYEGQVFAFTGYNFAEEKPEVLSTVYISDDLVSLALNLAHAKDKLQLHDWVIRSFVE